MIIKITDSKLFTVDPAIRFADAYRVTPDIFQELWRRYRLLEYSIPELCEVFYIKVGKPINHRKMNDWMFRGRIYYRVQEIRGKGVQAVSSEFFGDMEERLVNDLFRHIKHGETTNLNSLA